MYLNNIKENIQLPVDVSISTLNQRFKTQKISKLVRNAEVNFIPFLQFY